MRALQNRLRRLETRFVEPEFVLKPRKHLRIVIKNLGGEPRVTSSPCRRMLCPGGTLMEVVHFSACGTQDIDQWVASFPVLTLTAGGSVQ
jgi:hypothetical protein